MIKTKRIVHISNKHSIKPIPVLLIQEASLKFVQKINRWINPSIKDKKDNILMQVEAYKSKHLKNQGNFP